MTTSNTWVRHLEPVTFLTKNPNAYKRTPMEDEEQMFLEAAINAPVDESYIRVTRGQHSDVSLSELDVIVFPYFEMLVRDQKSFGWQLKEFSEQIETVSAQIVLTHLIQLNNLANDMYAEPTHLLMVRTQQFKPDLITNRKWTSEEMDW